MFETFDLNIYFLVCIRNYCMRKSVFTTLGEKRKLEFFVFGCRTGFYHDPQAGWYYSSTDGHYYSFVDGNYVLLESNQVLT